jgi:hypothetical protein
MKTSGLLPWIGTLARRIRSKRAAGRHKLPAIVRLALHVSRRHDAAHEIRRHRHLLSGHHAASAGQEFERSSSADVAPLG